MTTNKRVTDVTAETQGFRIIISKSDNKNKKYKAVINGEKTIHFGDSISI